MSPQLLIGHLICEARKPRILVVANARKNKLAEGVAKGYQAAPGSLFVKLFCAPDNQVIHGVIVGKNQKENNKR